MDQASIPPQPVGQAAWSYGSQRALAWQGALSGRSVSQATPAQPHLSGGVSRQAPAGPLHLRQVTVMPAVAGWVPGTRQPHPNALQQVPAAFAGAGAHAYRRCAEPYLIEPYHAGAYGTAPHGTAPHGTAPHGTAPHGTAPHGTAPHGTAPYGTAPYGTAPHGTAPYGTAPYGTAPYGTAPYGTAPHGTAPYGTAPYGTAPYGTAPYGTAPHGTAPYDTAPYVTEPEGTEPDGTESYGAESDGVGSDGVESDSTGSGGTEPGGSPVAHPPVESMPSLRHYPRSGEMTPPSWIRHVHATLPVGSRTTVQVESVVCPGAVIGSQFPDGYREAAGESLLGRALAPHVPGLAHSTLANPAGERLFSGLYHGFMGLPELSGDWLRGQPENEMCTLLGRYCIVPLLCEGFESYKQRVMNAASQARQDERRASIYAGLMQKMTLRHMMTEAVTAASLSDPSNIQPTDQGLEANLRLMVIMLAGSEDRESWAIQRAACCSIFNMLPGHVQVRRGDGSVLPVKVRSDIRAFTLSTDHHFVVSAAERELAIASGGPEPKTATVSDELLGPTGLQSPQGWVGFRLRRLDEALMGSLDLIQGHTRSIEQASDLFGPNHATVIGHKMALGALANEQKQLKTRVAMLKSVWQQLQQLRGGCNDWPAGPEVSRKVGARLALMAHLLGETPVISCRAGDNRPLRQLDAEVKFLAAAADRDGGCLPPIDADAEVWGQFRSAFDDL